MPNQVVVHTLQWPGNRGESFWILIIGVLSNLQAVILDLESDKCESLLLPQQSEQCVISPSCPLGQKGEHLMAVKGKKQPSSQPPSPYPHCPSFPQKLFSLM